MRHALEATRKSFEDALSARHSPLGAKKASDEPYLKQVTSGVLEKYIADAPSGGDAVPEDRFRKLHRKKTSDDMLRNKWVNQGKTVHDFADFYASVVEETSPRYRAATPPVEARAAGEWGVVDYKMDHMKDDRRVEYESSEFPWLKSVHKYTV